MSIKGKYVYGWPRPMVSVDAVVFAFAGASRKRTKSRDSKLKVKLLLIKRGKEPFKGHWALPGGFVGIDEELETAVARELAEETGLRDVKLEQMHTFGKVGRDPRGRQITIAYIGITNEGFAKIKGGDDAAEAKWFDIEKLPSELAFDHNEIVEFAKRAFKAEKDLLKYLSKCSRAVVRL